MAVSKLWSVTSRLGQVIDYAANPEKTAADIYTEEQYQALRDVLSYAKDEEKTEREFFVEGINCNPATARDQFISVKKAYGKDDGIQAYHGYLSFKSGVERQSEFNKRGEVEERGVWVFLRGAVQAVHGVDAFAAARRATLAGLGLQTDAQIDHDVPDRSAAAL